MPVIGWVDTEGIAGLWPDSIALAPEDVEALLQAAYEQCHEYAPVLPVGAVVPERYRQAQLLQAQENSKATRREGDVIGFADEGYAVRVRPLGTSVKALLRPRTGVPRVG